MDFIKRILLIFVLVLTTFSFADVSANELSSNSSVVITSINSIERQYLNTTGKECAISMTENNSASIIQRRSGNSNQAQNSETPDIPKIKQFNELISYIHNKSYLEDKNELALLLLLHQIQPNAP